MSEFKDQVSNFLKHNFMDKLKDKTRTAHGYAYIEMSTPLASIICDESIESAKNQIVKMWGQFTQMHNYQINETKNAIELVNVEMQIVCSKDPELKAIIQFKHNGDITPLKQLYGYGDCSYQHFVQYGNYLVYPKSKE